MKYRSLGRTGLLVSEIGFGCGNVGGLMVRGSLDEQVAAVSHALKLGINYFDTAPQYGNGKSETNLGLVLKQLRPEVKVASKVGLSKEDLNDLNGAIQSSLETSLNRLGLERLDLLQLHTPVSVEQGADTTRWTVGMETVLGKGGIADAFERMRSQKLVDYLGFTGLGETSAIHQVVRSNRFDVVQTYYNLLNPTSGFKINNFVGQDFGGLIDAATERRMGVVVIRIMAGGAIGGQQARKGLASPSVGGALVPGSDYGADEERSKTLDFLVSGGIHTKAQAAVTFALMNANVSTVLVGFSDVGQIDEAASCSGAAPLPATAIAKLRKLWSSDFAAI